MNGNGDGVIKTNKVERMTFHQDGRISTGDRVGYPDMLFNARSTTHRTAVEGEYAGTSGTGVSVAGSTSSPNGAGVYSIGKSRTIGTKSFIQPHPTDASKELNFVCLEGNESGTYFRGTGRLIGGFALIEVPEDFRLVTEERGLTVQVTAIGQPAGLWVESRSLERIAVRGLADVEFDYFVNGVRRG